MKHRHRPWRTDGRSPGILVLLLCSLVLVPATSYRLDDIDFVGAPNATISEPDSITLNPKQPTEPTPLPKLNATAAPALIVIDVQNCFLPGGAIPVAGGTDVVPVINALRDAYYWKTVVRSPIPRLRPAQRSRGCAIVFRIRSMAYH